VRRCPVVNSASGHPGHWLGLLGERKGACIDLAKRNAMDLSSDHLQQPPNNSFPITGIGRCSNSNFKIIGGVTFTISQSNYLIGRVTTSHLFREMGGELLGYPNNY